MLYLCLSKKSLKGASVNKMYAIALGIMMCSFSLNAVVEELLRVQSYLDTFKGCLNDFIFYGNLQMNMDDNPEVQQETFLSWEASKDLSKTIVALSQAKTSVPGSLAFNTYIGQFYEFFISGLEAFLKRMCEEEPEAVDRKRACLNGRKYAQGDTHTVERLLGQIVENIAYMQKVTADSMQFVGLCDDRQRSPFGGSQRFRRQ